MLGNAKRHGLTFGTLGANGTALAFMAIMVQERTYHKVEREKYRKFCCDCTIYLAIHSEIALNSILYEHNTDR